MTFLLAEGRSARDALVEAVGAVAVIAAIAVAFGVAYWLIRRRVGAAETARRKAEFAERRAKRAGGKTPPPAA